MSEAREYESRVMEALQRAVTKALERKRQLGQYAVFWRDGRPVCVGPDAPQEPMDVGPMDNGQLKIDNEQ